MLWQICETTVDFANKYIREFIVKPIRDFPENVGTAPEFTW